MKYYYLIILIIVLFVLGCCYISTFQDRQRFSLKVRRLLAIAVVVVASHLFITLTDKLLFAYIGFSLYYISTDFLVFLLILFLKEFSGIEAGFHEKRIRIAYCICMVFDTICMVSNCFEPIFFTVSPENGSDGMIYFLARGNLLFMIHLTIVYSLCMGVLYLLFKATVNKPIVYIRKYLFIFLVLFLIVYFDAIYVIFHMSIDLSIMFYGLVGMLVYYYSLRYVPKTLIHETLKLATDNFKGGLVIYDLEDSVVYTNTVADELFGERDMLVTTVKSWSDGKSFKETDAFNKVCSFHKKFREYKLEVQFSPLRDRKDRYIGCFFLIEDKTGEIRRTEEERYQAAHDPLTGLYRREYFFKKIRERLLLDRDEEYVLVCSDIARFKMVNDLFGSDVGDKVLKKIGEMLRIYSKGNDIYGYLGNDKFGMLIPQSRFDKNVFINLPEQSVRVEKDLNYPLAIYIGVYEIVDRSVPVPVMVDRAYMAISSIKHDFDKRLAVYDDRLRDSVMAEQSLIRDFPRAIKNDELQFFIQPQALKDGSVQGGEALVRWIHPELGMIAPFKFIPVFEGNGMIGKLDAYIWEKVCQKLKEWKSAGKEEWYISINVSPKDIFLMDVYEVITSLVQKYEISPANLRIEITETAIMLDENTVIALVDRLREFGFTVEMDDFGSGYSSLNMLNKINVDVLKLDMGFLRNSDNSTRSRQIVKSMIDLATNLGIRTITEGVETKDQLDFLTQMGCEVFQGYYFSKPVEVAEFEKTYMFQEA